MCWSSRLPAPARCCPTRSCSRASTSPAASARTGAWPVHACSTQPCVVEGARRPCCITPGLAWRPALLCVRAVSMQVGACLLMHARMGPCAVHMRSWRPWSPWVDTWRLLAGPPFAHACVCRAPSAGRWRTSLVRSITTRGPPCWQHPAEQVPATAGRQSWHEATPRAAPPSQLQLSCCML